MVYLKTWRCTKFTSPQNKNHKNGRHLLRVNLTNWLEPKKMSPTTFIFIYPKVNKLACYVKAYKKYHLHVPSHSIKGKHKKQKEKLLLDKITFYVYRRNCRKFISISRILASSIDKCCEFTNIMMLIMCYKRSFGGFI